MKLKNLAVLLIAAVMTAMLYTLGATVYSAGNASMTTKAHNGDTKFLPWVDDSGNAKTTSLPTSGSYYLTDDVKCSTVKISGELNLCLDGHSINLQSGYIQVSGTLNICNHSDNSVVTITTNNTNDLGCIYLAGGKLNITGTGITVSAEKADTCIYNNAAPSLTIKGVNKPSDINIIGGKYGMYCDAFSKITTEIDYATIKAVNSSTAGIGSGSGIYYAGHINVSNSKVSGTNYGIYLLNGASISDVRNATITNTDINDEGNSGIGIYLNGSNHTKLDVKGGCNIYGSTGIKNESGKNDEKTEITIDSGTITASEYCVYTTSGILNIKGGTFSSGTTGILSTVAAKTVNITDSGVNISAIGDTAKYGVQIETGTLNLSAGTITGNINGVRIDDPSVTFNLSGTPIINCRDRNENGDVSQGTLPLDKSAIAADIYLDGKSKESFTTAECAFITITAPLTPNDIYSLYAYYAPGDFTDSPTILINDPDPPEDEPEKKIPYSADNDAALPYFTPAHYSDFTYGIAKNTTTGQLKFKGAINVEFDYYGNYPEKNPNHPSTTYDPDVDFTVVTGKQPVMQKYIWDEDDKVFETFDTDNKFPVDYKYEDYQDNAEEKRPEYELAVITGFYWKGYEFEYWETDDGKKVDPSSLVGKVISGNYGTLHAHWKPCTHLTWDNADNYAPGAVIDGDPWIDVDGTSGFHFCKICTVKDEHTTNIGPDGKVRELTDKEKEYNENFPPKKYTEAKEERASCTSNGKAYYKCDNCNHYHLYTELALGHDFTGAQWKYEDDTNHVMYCIRYSDDEDKGEEYNCKGGTDSNNVYYKKTEKHDIDEKNWTYHEEFEEHDEYHYQWCEDCKEWIKQKHDWQVDTEKSYDPIDCKTPGMKYQYCTICGKHDDGTPTDPKPHNYNGDYHYYGDGHEEHPEDDEHHKDDGHWQECEWYHLCGTVGTGSTQKSDDGTEGVEPHSFTGDPVIIESPDCQTPEQSTWKCVCNAEHTEYGDKRPHDFTIYHYYGDGHEGHAEDDEHHKDDGHWQECSYGCGTTINTDPLGDHKWEKLESSTDPDCGTETPGHTYEECSECHAKRDYEVAPEHDWQPDPSKESTESDCTTPGKKFIYCTKCRTTDSEDLELKDHNYIGEYGYDEDGVNKGHYKQCQWFDKCGTVGWENETYKTKEGSLVDEYEPHSFTDHFTEESSNNCQTKSTITWYCICGAADEPTEGEPGPHDFAFHHYGDGHEGHAEDEEHHMEDGHWQECRYGCGTTIDTDPLAEHRWAKLPGSTEPDCVTGEQGHIIEECSDCFAIRERYEDPTHEFGGEWFCTLDEFGNETDTHYQLCQKCFSAKSEPESHEFGGDWICTLDEFGEETDEGHYQLCEKCGAKSDVEMHEESDEGIKMKEGDEEHPYVEGKLWVLYVCKYCGHDMRWEQIDDPNDPPGDGDDTEPEETTTPEDGDGDDTKPEETTTPKDGDGDDNNPEETTTPKDGDGDDNNPEETTTPEDGSGDNNNPGETTTPEDSGGDNNNPGETTTPEDGSGDDNNPGETTTEKGSDSGEGDDGPTTPSTDETTPPEIVTPDPNVPTPGETTTTTYKTTTPPPALTSSTTPATSVTGDSSSAQTSDIVIETVTGSGGSGTGTNGSGASTGTNLGFGWIIVRVEVKAGAPDTTLTNRSTRDLEQETVNKHLSADERSAIESGNIMEIVLTVTDLIKDEDVTDEDKQLAETYLANSLYNEGEYLDVSIIKLLNGAEVGRITQLDTPITVTFDIPENLRKENRLYAMLRLHDGSADLLRDLDDQPDTLTVMSDKFSTYVIVYRDLTDDVADDMITSNPSTGTTLTGIYILALICPMTVLATVFNKKRTK